MASGSEAWTQKRSEKLDLNSASEQELEGIRGLGAQRARQIVEYREQNGGFESVDDLREIEGFADILTNDFRNAVTVHTRR